MLPKGPAVKARFTLHKMFRFEAAHHLANHNGKCKRLHGHSWKGTLVIEADQLQTGDDNPQRGMVMDFGEISKLTESMIGLYLDHHYLNETLLCEDPTCEAVAVWVYEFMKPRIPQLAAVRIEETCTSACEYRP